MGIDFYTVKNVEAVRGPAFMGANPGGIINLVSEQPFFDKGGVRGTGSPMKGYSSRARRGAGSIWASIHYVG